MSSPTNTTIPVETITTLCNNAIHSPIADIPLGKCCTQQCLARCSYMFRNSQKSDKINKIIGKTCADMCQYIKYRPDHTCRNSKDAPFTLPPSMLEPKYADHTGVTFPTFKDDEIQTLVQNAAVHSPWKEDGPLDASTQKKIKTARNHHCKQTCCDNIKKSLNNPPNFPDEACLKGQSTKYSGEIFRMFTPCASATWQKDSGKNGGKCTCTVPIIDRTGNCDTLAKRIADTRVWKNYPASTIPPLIADYLKSIKKV